MTIALHPENHRRGHDRVRNAGVIAGVTAAHLAVFLIMARLEPPPPSVLPPPPIVVDLIRPILPPPPPPPPPPAPPSPQAGGGAPAAPSRIHTPPPPKRPVPPELPAPKVQAPEPALVVGVSDKASPTPGFGQGGQGTGNGTGFGAGDGPGRGAVLTPPRNLRRASRREVFSMHPREARSVRAFVVVSCRMRPDTRLDRCRTTIENPPGYGFGAAATRVATEFYRFQPPMADGVPLDDRTVSIEVDFGLGVQDPVG